MIIGQFEAKIGKHDIVYKEKFAQPIADFPIETDFLEKIENLSNSP